MFLTKFETQFYDVITSYYCTFWFLFFDVRCPRALPNDWLKARVIPVSKKGNRQSVGNYRPILLTRSARKMMEHILANYIVAFLDERDILTLFSMASVCVYMCNVVRGAMIINS